MERFNFMKEYFDDVSSNEELRFNKAFLKIYRHLQQQKLKEDRENNVLKAPVIKGKKLELKQQAEREVYIVV